MPEPWRYFRNEIWFQARPSKTWITFAYQIIKIYVSVLCVYIFIICSQTWWVNFDLMSGFFWWDSILKISIPRNRNGVAFSNAIKILLRIAHFSDMKLKYLKEFPLNNFLNSLNIIRISSFYNLKGLRILQLQLIEYKGVKYYQDWLSNRRLLDMILEMHLFTVLNRCSYCTFEPVSSNCSIFTHAQWVGSIPMIFRSPFNA